MEIKPGDVIRLHAEGELPATAWTLQENGEVIASGDFAEAPEPDAR